MKAYRAAVASFLLIFLSACQTTGDPNAGGLFGWSEEKAKQRAEAQRRHKASLDSEIREVNQDNVELADEADNLDSLLDSRRNAIARLMDEQISLIRQIERLKVNNVRDESRLKELVVKSLTKRNGWEMSDRVTLSERDLTEETMKTMESQNKVLLQEILLLTGN